VTTSYIQRKILTKIIYSINKFSIDYNELPKQITIGRGEFVFIQDVPGFNMINIGIKKNEIVGYLNGLEVLIDDNIPFIDVMEKFPYCEFQFKLSSGTKEEYYYINKDIQKEREDSIDKLLR
jgi:hypothetical protein